MRATYLDEPLSGVQRNTIDTLGYDLPDIRTPWPALRCGVDAVHSKIAKTHPRCRVLTEDGDWELQTRAELLTTWLDGEFDALGLDEIGERVFLDALIDGTGAIYTGVRHDEPYVERVRIRDLYVDPLEQVHDAVRSLYRVRRMDCGVLCELFPGHEEEIRKAKRLDPDPDLSPITGEVADIVMVIEAWRLADGPKSKGRHSIVIDGGTLLDDREWVGKRFPFSFVHWSRDPDRFFGVGLVEQMLAPQSELNDIAEQNSEARHLFVPIMQAEEGSTIEDMTNDVGRVYRYPLGRQPATVTYPSAMFESMARLEDAYIQRVWNLAGISQLSVASQKPAGLNSGKAIQNFTDVESERFAVGERSWERLFIDVGENLVAAAEDICKSDAGKAQKLSVMGGKDALESVTYADARLADKPSKIRVFPVSKFSNSLSAKIDEIEKLVTAQMIPDIEDARELMDIPDLKRFNTIQGAGRRLIRKIVDKALKYGEATSPDPYMPLPYFIKYASLSANYAAECGCPDAHVQALRDMVQFAIEMKQKQEAEANPPAPAMPPGPPMGGPPMGTPMMPGPPMGPPPMQGLAVVPPAGA